MKFSGFVYHVKDYRWELFNTFKIELENRYFRNNKTKKNKKNGLRLGAGIILNQELTYSRRWGKWAAGACQRPDIGIRKNIFC